MKQTRNILQASSETYNLSKIWMEICIMVTFFYSILPFYYII